MKTLYQFVESHDLTRTGKVYHGGSYDENSTNIVTYWSPNQKMAASYAMMTHDRYGGDTGVTEKTVTIRVAPEDTVNRVARSCGINPDEGTPASVFDYELHGENVVQLVTKLRRMGYTGTILRDIAYGDNIEDDAWIVFNV